jgi:hypothetical protein
LQAKIHLSWKAKQALLKTCFAQRKEGIKDERQKEQITSNLNVSKVSNIK